METIGNTQPKPRRWHRNATKEWTVPEEKELVNFLMENREFEKPTAQAYYRRFAAEKSIIMEWKLVRSKVRNMRISYNKAKAWKCSTIAYSMKAESVKTTLLKMCSFYDTFDEIAGSRLNAKGVSDESLQSDIFKTTEVLNLKEIAMTSACAVMKKETASSNCRKSIYSKAVVTDIMQVQAEMVKLKKQKIDQDLAIREKEIKIKEREVALKEKEMELKEKELHSQEKLKILELNMKERLAMEELKHKYN